MCSGGCHNNYTPFLQRENLGSKWLNRNRSKVVCPVTLTFIRKHPYQPRIHSMVAGTGAPILSPEVMAKNLKLHKIG